MSAEATAYVTALRKCPDGAELTCTQKCVLYCLADHHNRSTRRCYPSQRLIAEESLVSYDTVQRAVAYLDTHCVIERRKPANQGRGQKCSYVFLALDAPERLKSKLSQLEKGVHSASLFAYLERDAKGPQTAPERGAEGPQRPQRNKEEPRTKSNHESKAARPQRAPALSQAERDTLDLKRWQHYMHASEPQPGHYSADPDAEWRQRARDAAFDAGLSPVRVIELLKAHYPRDPNIDQLYTRGEYGSSTDAGNGNTTTGAPAAWLGDS